MQTEARDLLSRARGAFLGSLLGDALGRRFEMMSTSDARIRTGLEAMLVRRGPWLYTDDTQMMIAVAESLVRTGRVERSDLMAALAANYDPARGYGKGMKRAIEAFRLGRAPATATWTEGSRGSGGAVRVVPIGCAYHDDLERLAARAEDAAGVSHAHPVGRAGAVAHAVAIGSVLGAMGDLERDRVVEDVLWAVGGTALESGIQEAHRLARRAADAGEAARVLGNGLSADEAVPLALFCFLRWAPNVEDAVTNAILAGGDTDTIAAMTGALCGALVGEEGLPPTWLERCENGPRGVGYVRSLADAISELWSRRGARREEV